MNRKYKYPFIPDKTMYAAVRYACKLIRETGYFNKAVENAADEYNVNEDELKKHIRARQAAGQKGVAKGRKYRWFILQEYAYNEADQEREYGHYSIIRATSRDNAKNHFTNSDFYHTMQDDYGGNYCYRYFHEIRGNEDGYDTKAAALKALAEIGDRQDVR